MSKPWGAAAVPANRRVGWPLRSLDEATNVGPLPAPTKASLASPTARGEVHWLAQELTGVPSPPLVTPVSAVSQSCRVGKAGFGLEPDMTWLNTGGAANTSKLRNRAVVGFFISSV